MKRLRFLFSVMLTLAVSLGGGVAWWMLNPSRAYYEPIAASVEQVDDGTWLATVTRQLPRGDVWGRWSVTVWVRRDEASFVCIEPMGAPVLFQSARGPSVTYELPASITWTRQILLLSWIPTLPVSTTITLGIESSIVESEG